LRTSVHELSAKERKALSEPAKAPGEKFTFEPTHAFLLLTVIFGGLAAWAYTDKSGFLILAAVLGLSAIAGFVMAIIGAFKDGDMLWGIFGIAVLLGGSGAIPMLYYVFVKSERAMNKAIFGANLLGVAAVFIVFTHHGASPDQLGG